MGYHRLGEAELAVRGPFGGSGGAAVRLHDVDKVKNQMSVFTTESFWGEMCNK